MTLSLLIALSFANTLSAQSLTQGYESDQFLQRGTLVAADPDDSAKVEPLTADSLERAKGVVVQEEDTPVTLSSDSRKIFVASSGELDVLVSDQNGRIKEGDYIAASSLEGVGMKAGIDHPVVVGRAVKDFKPDNSLAVTGGSGTSYDTGLIKAAVNIRNNPLAESNQKNKIPKLLEDVGETIADKPVSSFRLYISAALFLATVVVVGFMLYAGVRNSLIAIGRNPLSKKTISRSLFQVIFVGLVIFITGMFGVYLLLKL